MENCPFCDAPGAYREAKDGTCYVCGMMLPNLSGRSSTSVAPPAKDSGYVLEEDDAANDTEETVGPSIPSAKHGEPTVVVQPSRTAPTVHMEDTERAAIELIKSRNLSPEYAARITAAFQAKRPGFKDPRATIDANMSVQADADQLIIGTRTVSRSESEGRGDYMLKKEIGRGAMGSVWSARQASLDREVALKFPMENPGGSSSGRQLFISEVVVTGQLDHPNIVPIHDLCRDDSGQLFYAMKLVEGVTWDECMHNTGRTRHDNVEVLMKVCDAVRFAHDRNVLHRDIKPQNIMIGRFGEVSVMDWGIALKMPEGTQDPGSAKISPSGTPAYMAPEMATGNMNEIGWHTDVYLLGAVLYEIITGEPPHPAPASAGDSRVQLKASLLIAARNEITPAKETGELIDIAYRAMATDIYDRYQTVDEFQAAIRNYFEHAESIALAERGEAHLTNAREARNGVYEDFAKARFAFDEAIQLWPENKRARYGLSDATHDYAGSALERGDYALGLSLLKDDDPEHADLVKRLRSAKRRQDRNRLMATVSALAASLFLIGALGVYYVYSNKLIAAHGNLEVATKKQEAAERQEKLAVQKQQGAEKLADAAKQSAADAQKLQEVAEKNKALAEANTKAAEAKQKAAEDKARLADAAVVSANQRTAIANQQVEQTSYSSDIKSIADYIQHNAFPDAVNLLKKIEKEDEARKAAGRAPLRNVEWNNLMAQADVPSKSRLPGTGTSPVNSVAVSPDQKWFAAAADNGTVYVWQAAANKPPLSLKHDSLASAVVFSADSNTLVVAAGSTVSFYALPLDGQGDQLKSAGQPLQYVTGTKDSTPQIRSVALSPVDPDMVLTSTDDHMAQLWSRKDPAKPSRTFKGHLVGPVWQARFSPDGKVIATAGDDGSVRLWNPNNEDTRPLDGHRGPVYAVEFSPDGKTLVSGGRDRRLLVWNVPSLDQLHASAEAIQNRLKSAQETQQSAEFRQLGEHKSSVQCLSFSPDGKVLFSGCDDNTLGVWDTSPGAKPDPRKSLRGHGGPVRSCAVIGDGRRVLSGSQDGQVFLWDSENYVFPDNLRAESTKQLRLTSVAASPDARWVATAAEDGQITMWDMSQPLNPTSQSLIVGHDWQATTGAFFQASDPKHQNQLLTVGGDNSAIIWDATSGNQLVRMGGWNVTNGTGWRGVGAASHNGQWIATGSNDKAILAKLWNATTGELVHSLAVPMPATLDESPEAAAIAFSPPDDQMVFVGAQSGHGYLFRTKDGSLIKEKELNGHEKKINAARFLPNRHLLTASSDFSVIEWDLGSDTEMPRQLRSLPHRDRVVAMDASPDGNLLVTVADSLNDDTVLRLWDLKGTESPRGLTLAELVGTKRAAVKSEKQGLQNESQKREKATINQRPAVRSVAFSPDQPQVLVTLYDPPSSTYELYTWNWADKQNAVHKVTPGLRDTSMAMYSPIQKGSILTVGGRGARLRLPDQVITNYRPPSAVQSIGFSPSGQMLAAATKDGPITLWRFDGAKNRWMSDRTLSGHNGSVNSAVFHPKRDDVLLSAGSDGTVRLWSPVADNWTPTPLHNDAGNNGPANQAIFSPPDETGSCEIFAAVGDKVCVWNSDGNPSRQLKVNQQVGCLAVSPNREWLVAGVGNQAWVYKRDAREGEPVQKLPGHSAEITALAFSKDAGERLFTASRNRQVKVWDATLWASADPKQTAAHELLTLEQHRDSVVSLSLFPSAKYPALLSAGTDGQAILWRYGSVR